MTLEQRVEALEKVVEVLVGGKLSANGGRMLIGDALMHDGSIKAANIQAAKCSRNLDKTMEIRDENGSIRFRCQSLSNSQLIER